MPCEKCKDGKWKYGTDGDCQFSTKKECEDARKAIHARRGGKKGKKNS